MISISKQLAAGMAVAASLLAAPAAQAAACGNTSKGFEAWVENFKAEAASQGVSARTLDKVFSAVNITAPPFAPIAARRASS